MKALAFRLYVVALGGAWLCVVLYVAVASLPFTAVRPPGAHRLDLALFLPQGWAFFTRNPREPRMSIYRPRGDGTWTPSSSPQSSAGSLFGLRRDARARGAEAGELVAHVAGSSWINCGAEEPSRCLARQPVRFVAVRDLSPRPQLCGELAVVLQEPLPWAWSGSARTITMPSRVVRLRVQC